MPDLSNESAIHESKEIKQRVSKIHFLIHPGFLMAGVPKEGSEPGSTQDRYNSLLDEYVKKAEEVKDKINELMFAFIWSSRKDFKEALQEQQLYVEKLKEIKNLLGNRLIVFSGNRDVTDDGKQFVAYMERIAQARGYIFDSDVLSEAYGETLGSCVNEGAVNLNKALGLKSKTVILPELTSAILTTDPAYVTEYEQTLLKDPNINAESNFIEINDLNIYQSTHA